MEKMMNSLKRKLFFRTIIALSFVFIMLSLSSLTCSAADYEDYAPILYFEKEETCYPVDANYHIDYSYLYEISNTNPISQNPTSGEIGGYSSDTYQYYYLDNTQGTVDNEKVISHYQNRNKNQYPETVYYRRYTSGDTTVIQYWMFYAFNKGELNQHEGDWEMVQVVIPATGEKWVGYSQHLSGQQACWDLVEKSDNHIKVYVARGSHANYLRSYSGKLGISSDHVGDNGVVLQPGDYELVDITTQQWLDFRGRWGEVPDDVDQAISDTLFGKIGPEGPKYRVNGDMWDSPLDWGSSLMGVGSTFFLMEWFLYNFITIFLAITALTIAIMLFFIYRRHKKYGLGPRIVSMLYIDTFDIKSIGNILVFVGIIMVLIGLFLPWYGLSYSISGAGLPENVITDGMVDAIKFDGVNGVEIVIPGVSGQTPIGAFIIPFSLFIGIGIVLLVLSSVGQIFSRKLGYKYLKRGIAVMFPILMIVIFLLMLGTLIPSDVGDTSSGGEEISDIMRSISNSPFGGEKSVTIVESGVSADLTLKWGMGIGGTLLLFGGIIMIIAGVFEVIANKTFFEPKTPFKTKKKWFGRKKEPVMQQTPPYQNQPMPAQTPQTQQQPAEKSETTDDFIFCTECGKKIPKNAEFCPECGKKLK